MSEYGHNTNSDSGALPLSNHRLYDGDDVDDAREVLSRIFTEIALDPLNTGQSFRAQVNGVELPRIAICYLRFENGAVAGPVQPLDFHTLQLNLTGNSIYNTDDGASGGDSEHGVMLSAGQTVRNRHSAANGHLALVVKDDVIRHHLARHIGQEKAHALRFAGEFDFAQPRTASLLSFIETFTRELNRPGGILEAQAAVASFEDYLLTSLLLGLEHNQTGRLDKRASGSAPEHVRKLEEYMSAYASQPIDIATLTEISGLSGASIHRAFRKHRGYTPMQFLQEQRMHLVRRRLLFSGPTDSVSSIAMECGFFHLGRFAADYRRRFNENPSQTIRRGSSRAISAGH